MSKTPSTSRVKKNKLKEDIESGEETLEQLVQEQGKYMATFFMESLTLDKDFKWRLKLKVQQTLSRAFSDYMVKLEFNEEPFDSKENMIERKIEEVESEATLFKEETEKKVKKLRQDIDKNTMEAEALRRNCPTIEFFARVEKIEYPGADTKLVLVIPDNVIGELNDRKYFLNSYVANLQPKI